MELKLHCLRQQVPRLVSQVITVLQAPSIRINSPAQWDTTMTLRVANHPMLASTVVSTSTVPTWALSRRFSAQLELTILRQLRLPIALPVMLAFIAVRLLASITSCHVM